MSEKQVIEQTVVRPVTRRRRARARERAHKPSAKRTQHQSARVGPQVDQVEGMADLINSITRNAKVPVDAFAVAEYCGLRVVAVGPGEENFDWHEIRFNQLAPYLERHAFVMRCVAHRALWQLWQNQPTLGDVERLSRALTIPRNLLIADLAVESNRSMEWLRRRYCTSETIIRARLMDVGMSVDKLVADPPSEEMGWTSCPGTFVPLLNTRQHHLTRHELQELIGWVYDGNPDDLDSLETELLARRAARKGTKALAKFSLLRQDVAQA
jgi:hypothetical protein